MIHAYRFDWGPDPAKDHAIPFEEARVFHVGAQHVAESGFYQRFFALAPGGRG